MNRRGFFARLVALPAAAVAVCKAPSLERLVMGEEITPAAFRLSGPRDLHRALDAREVRDLTIVCDQGDGRYMKIVCDQGDGRYMKIVMPNVTFEKAGRGSADGLTLELHDDLVDYA